MRRRYRKYMTEYKLIRSRRQTIGLYIRNGALEVRAPLQCPQKEIDRFIATKQDWVERHLATSQTQAAARQAFVLDYHAEILYRGKLYPIIARAGIKAGFDGVEFYLPPALDADAIMDICIKIYRRLAKTYFSQRVNFFAVQIGIQPSAVKINGAKTRWGSCSGKKSINFSWRLIMADDEVIDYVVVHELAHLLEMNHSDRFWAVVARVLPDFRNRQAKLKTLQMRLSTEHWN